MMMMMMIRLTRNSGCSIEMMFDGKSRGIFIPRREKEKDCKMRVDEAKALIIDWSPLPRLLHPVFPSLSQI